MTADQVVIAAGSRATVPAAIAESGVDYHTSDTIMRIADVPEHLVIVGGGFVAAEFAHIFSALGTRVTLVIRGSTLLRQCDDTICERFTDIAAKKWEIRSHHTVTGASQGRGGVTLTLDDGSAMRADTVLVATGRTPNGDLLDAELAGVKVADGLVTVDEYQRTTARGIFALGDVCSPYQLKHVANHEARVVRHNLLQDWDDTDALMPSDHRYVPSAVFTDPQIAMVGLTENQARANGFDIKVKIQDYSDVAYGWAMEDTTGIAKIIVENETGKILGAHIMGHQASSLIQDDPGRRTNGRVARVDADDRVGGSRCGQRGRRGCRRPSGDRPRACRPRGRWSAPVQYWPGPLRPGPASRNGTPRSLRRRACARTGRRCRWTGLRRNPAAGHRGQRPRRPEAARTSGAGVLAGNCPLGGDGGVDAREGRLDLFDARCGGGGGRVGKGRGDRRRGQQHRVDPSIAFAQVRIRRCRPATGDVKGEPAGSPFQAPILLPKTGSWSPPGVYRGSFRKNGIRTTQAGGRPPSFTHGFTVRPYPCAPQFAQKAGSDPLFEGFFVRVRHAFP